MKRNYLVFGLMGALVGSYLLVSPAAGQSQDLITQAAGAVSEAEMAVDTARIAIGRGKDLYLMIPEDSPMFSDVAQVLEEASRNWKVAIASLDGAKESASKVSTAASESVASDYALLAKANAGVALSGAKVVEISIAYVDAIANNKTEALGVIRIAMRDALEVTSQIQVNYERIKTLIAEKYSK
ncbi:MAG: hypothetical protein HKP10_05680 [Kiritimatiellales bacterium]|nr:hypothetical protein [Kiritimatiellales bacterium]